VAVYNGDHPGIHPQMQRYRKAGEAVVVRLRQTLFSRAGSGSGSTGARRVPSGWPLEMTRLALIVSPPASSDAHGLAFAPAATRPNPGL